ncbi:hypothetical protein ES703_78617 [subsurface metagenome]
MRVAAGTYNAASGEVFPINLPSGVELVGAGSGVCTIDAGFSGTVISCVGDDSSKIEGFLIINGGGPFGGGIMCESWSSPIIVNNIIAGSNILFYGGGINCDADSFPLIVNNVIVGNSAGFDGGGIYCYYSSPNIIHNTIVGNSGGRYGGGIYCGRFSNPVVTNNIILNNRASTGGGIYCYPPSYPINSYNDMFGNIPTSYVNCPPGAGDIYADPELVDYDPVRIDYTANDYHLQSYSFCVDAGTNDFIWLVDFDFDGHLRPLDGDGDESAVVDIGVDEVIPPPVADAGSYPNVSADDDCQATVTLDGSGSYDPGGGDLTYTWTGPFDDVTGATPTVTLGLGTHTILLTVSNGTDTVTDEVEITVEDTTPPELAQLSLPDVTGECSAEITTYPTATDTCSENIITGTTEDPLFYDEQGNYTVIWTYTDDSGNTATQTQRVIVQDVTAPDSDVATLPTVEGVCSAEITEYPTATDNCSGTITGTTTDSLIYTDQDTHTVTWTFDDGNGNRVTQTQTVIVQDVTAPVPDVAALLDVSGECSAEITAVPTATDNCVGSVVGTTSDPLIYTENGPHTVTWTYDDGNGNSVTQTQTVIVQDVTAPVPDEATLPDVSGECSVEITTAPTAKDNCAGPIVGTTSDPLSYTEHGTHTVTWTYDDGNGNVATQTQTVTVEDVTPPEIHLSDPSCVKIKKFKLANKLTVNAQDNCSSDVEWTVDRIEIFNRGGRRVWGRGVYSVNGNDIYIYPKGRGWSVLVTVTATDSSGNTTTDQFSKSLLRCNRMSEQMARWLRWLFYMLWRMGRC